MANADFTLISTEQSRAGAVACMGALRAIENIASSEGPEIQMCQYWRNEDSAVALTLRAAGDASSGYLGGFIAVFAEYVKMSHAGTPDLDKWIPEAAMTEEEKALNRVE